MIHNAYRYSPGWIGRIPAGRNVFRDTTGGKLPQHGKSFEDGGAELPAQSSGEPVRRRPNSPSRCSPVGPAFAKRQRNPLRTFA